MTTKRFLAALAAGTLLFAACGDDDDGGGSSAESNEYSEALAAQLSSEEDLPLEGEQVDCLAAEFIDAVGGPSALEDAGVTPEDIADSEDVSELGLDLGEEEAEELASSFGDCDISLTELIISQAGDDIPDEVRDCVEDNLDEDALADFFAQTIIDEESAGDDLPPDIMEGLLGCF